MRAALFLFALPLFIPSALEQAGSQLWPSEALQAAMDPFNQAREQTPCNFTPTNTPLESQFLTALWFPTSCRLTNVRMALQPIQGTRVKP
jgi:hypothetical protein